jgi:hypothetical protein
MTEDLKNIHLKKGESVAWYGHKIMAITQQDKKPVSLLSTVHNSFGMTSTKKTNRKTGEVIMNLWLIITRVWGMGGVDKTYQQLASYPLIC